MELTPEQVTQFDRDGYLLFPNLFSEEEVDILRHETDRADGRQPGQQSADNHRSCVRLGVKHDFHK